MAVLTVEKLISRGEGLARLDGKVVFLPYTAPGDRVKVEITEEKKGYSRGKVLKLLEPSPDRQDPFCPYYETCGGCNWQHLRYESQKRIKKELLLEIFQRAGFEDIPAIEVFTGPDKAYRCRVQFQKADSGKWGFYRRRSKEVIALEGCPLLTGGLNSFLQSPPEDCDNSDRLNVYGDEKQYWYREDQEIQREVFSKNLQFKVNHFFQSNIYLLEEFVKKTTEKTKGSLFLDLYGGVGLFSSVLEDHFQQGFLVESNLKVESSVKKNLSDRVRFIGKPLERWKEKLSGVDFAVVDPPRAGMDPNAINWLCAAGPREIRYVSCDPVTQARDINLFKEKGYSLKELSLFDFYPHTFHMETVAVLTK